MKKCFAVILVLLLAQAAPALAAPLSVAMADGALKTVRSSDFSTLAFTFSNQGDTPRTVSITWHADAPLSLVSNPAPVSLQPGASETLPLTFFIPDSGEGNADIHLHVAMADVENPDETASVDVVLQVESIACAHIENLPETFHLSGGRESLLAFDVVHCGTGHQSFELAVDPGARIAAGPLPAIRNMSPGAKQRIILALRPAPTDVEEDARIRLDILYKGRPLDTRSVYVVVRPFRDAPPKKSRAVFPLRLTVDHMARTSQDAHTSVRMSVPTVLKGNTALRTDATMDDSHGKFEVRRSYLDLMLDRTRLVGGNQQLTMSDILQQGSRPYEGWRVDRPAPGGSISLFSGSDAGADVQMYQWRIAAGPRLDLRLGHLSERDGSATGSHLKADTLRAAFTPGKTLSLDAEIIRASDSAHGGEPARAGTAFRLGGAYQGGNFQISTNFQGGDKEFPRVGRLKKFSLHADYTPVRRTRLFMDFRRETGFRAEQTLDGGLVPYQHETHSAGFTRPVIGGIMVFASINSRSSDVRDADSPAQPAAARQAFYVLKLSRRTRSVTVAAEVESGSKTLGADRIKYRDYGVSAAYRNSGFTLNADLNRALHITDIGIIETENRTSSYALGYAFPGRNISLNVNWTGQASSSGAGARDKRERLEIRIEKRFKDMSTFGLTYEIDRAGANTDRMFWGAWSKTLDVKIPFSATGVVRGAVYHDTNRNGVRDPQDTPLPGVILNLKGIGAVMADDNGEYAFDSLLPGSYTLTLDSSSYAVGLKPGVGLPDFSVGGGRTVAMDIPLVSVYRLAGRVSLIDDSIFAQRANLSAAQLHILLLSGGNPIRETFTDKNGDYYFEGIEPGQYRIMLDETWLDAGAAVIGPAAHDVPESESASAQTYDFSIGLKQKKIITTFQN
jgi:hypothetical protein